MVEQRRWRGYVMVMGAAICWGVMATVVKMLFRDRGVDPVILMVARVDLAALILFAALVLVRPVRLRIERKDVWIAVVVGVGGLATNNYLPSGHRPIEPHTLVPFGGVFQSYYYVLFWAALGIRNGFQPGKGYREVAMLNWEYSKTGTRYLRKAEITGCAHRYFRRVDFVEDSYLKHCSGRSGSLYPLARILPGFKYL